MRRTDRRTLNKRIRELEADIARYHELYGPLPSPEQPFSTKRKRTVSPAMREHLARIRAKRQPQQRDPVTNRFVASGMVNAERQTADATTETVDTVSTD